MDLPSESKTVRSDATARSSWASWIPLALFVVFLLLLAIRIATPWQFLHDDNGAWFSATAKTHLLRGLEETKGQDFFLPRQSQALKPYLHHPPFISLYLAGVFRVTGADTPLVARASMALLHILTFLIFLRLAKMLTGGAVLPYLWAAFVFATVPMSVYFGKMPNHEVPGLLFLELGIFSSLNLKWREAASLKWLIPISLAWMLTAFSSWHAALAALVFILCFSIVLTPKARHLFLPVSGTVLLGSLALVGGQLLWANHWQWLPSQETAVRHWLGPEETSLPAFWLKNFTKIARHGCRFYAGIPWLLAFGWTLWAGIRLIRRQRLSDTDVFVLAMGLGSIIYCAVFSRAARIHAYQQFYSLPFIAIASALALSTLYDSLARWRKNAALSLVILLILSTALSALYSLSRLYLKANTYAVEAARAITTQFY